MKSKMKRKTIVLNLLLLLLFTMVFAPAATCAVEKAEPQAPGRTMARQATKEGKVWILETIEKI